MINYQAQFLSDLSDFVQGKPRKPVAQASSLLLDDLEDEPSISKNWECPPDFRKERYAPFLQLLAWKTGTKIAHDEFIEAVVVAGEDEAVIDDAIEQLTNIYSALSLLSPNPARQHHHIFLPSTGYDKLQVMPFKLHSAAAGIQAISTTEEWETVAKNGVIVPFRPELRHKAAPAPLHTPVVSRFLVSPTFKEFGNRRMYTEAPPSNQSTQASTDGGVVITPTAPATPEPALPVRPKGFYTSTLSSEKADQVTKWVDQNTATKSDAPLDPQQPVPPEEYPPEQKPIRGVLKRRPKAATMPPKCVESEAAEEQNSGELSSVSSLLAERPKPRQVLHRTMGQKTSPGPKPVTKQTTLDKYWLTPTEKQATLDKYWSPVSKHQTKPDNMKSEQRVPTPADLSPTSVKPGVQSELRESTNAITAKPESVQTQLQELARTMKPAVHPDSCHVLEIFNALQPTLEAARSFPGKLQLEAHIELVTITPLSDDQNFDMGYVTLDEWRSHFQPKRNRASAPYFACNKVTSSGGDVDGMVDLIWSKKNPERIFFEKPIDYETVLEYHCRMSNGANFVITLDESGNPTFHHAQAVLGCSTVHFPHRLWDINIVIKGGMNLQIHQDPTLKKGLDEFAKSIWFEPGESLVIFCCEPTNRAFTVSKILMKQTMRHRHQTMNEETESKLMLKTVEVREFIIGRKPQYPGLIRGRIPINDMQQCVSLKKLWYEISIVSDEIQKLLDGNRGLELGQETKGWSATDILGEEIEMKDIPYDSSEVAKSVGSSGLGGMYRLAKVVLDRMRVGE
ncbi:conserved hypothetical protein [Talaromyces stipitatus ATCC 10500]|uniref:Uncharacterized protein n=1 Tax=Talaromyces stipitatus (strain ATCC 10500 / CBS 375.48 / QM 6759 / NRRL 1006) TaxID=441959 RepID=B8MQJ7_TALSN|nr:uncharacterized protein TSTA_058870 [Talaromyces stipitatus ATCC 10500]EED13399.1 conserved hypothetical protein [Talaromyces stipitatus ATCC 10500]